MKIKQEPFEGQISEELTNWIIGRKQLINLDENDIKQVVDNHKGYTFICEQEEEDYTTFMKKGFKELSSKEEIKKSKFILINLETSGNLLNMEDMQLINDFMENIEDDFELKWGITQIEEDARKRIILIVSQ